MIDNSKVSNIPCRLHNVGEGGVAGADEVIDDLKGKTQQQINAEVDQILGAGGSVDERIAAAVAPKANSDDVYAKTETYSKTELNNMITTPEQGFVTVTATDETTDVTDVLPATGEANTIYRVGNWDGTQYNDSVFSEYAWNGSAYIKLSTKSQIGEVYDISANHADTKYADLAAALGTNGANIPQSLRKGGMSVKFVQTSDNKYVQYRLMANAFTTDVTQWQGVDNEPVAGSENLVKSGGILAKIEEKSTIVFKPVNKQYISSRVCYVRRIYEEDWGSLIHIKISDFSTSDNSGSIIGNIRSDVSEMYASGDVADSKWLSDNDAALVKIGRTVELFFTIDPSFKSSEPRYLCIRYSKAETTATLNVTADKIFIPIDSNVKEGSKNLIESGAVYQAINSLVNKGLVYKGSITPESQEISDDGIFCIGALPGTYTNFGNFKVGYSEIAIFKKTGGNWTKESFDVAKDGYLDDGSTTYNASNIEYSSRVGVIYPIPDINATYHIDLKNLTGFNSTYPCYVKLLNGLGFTSEYQVADIFSCKVGDAITSCEFTIASEYKATAKYIGIFCSNVEMVNVASFNSVAYIKGFNLAKLDLEIKDLQNSIGNVYTKQEINAKENTLSGYIAKDDVVNTIIHSNRVGKPYPIPAGASKFKVTVSNIVTTGGIKIAATKGNEYYSANIVKSIATLQDDGSVSFELTSAELLEAEYISVWESTAYVESSFKVTLTIIGENIHTLAEEINNQNGNAFGKSTEEDALMERRAIIEDAPYYMQDLSNDAEVAPTYTSYDEDYYLENKIRKVPDGKSFIFITDTHVPRNANHSSLLMSYLKKRLGINVGMFGGDCIDNLRSKYIAAAHLTKYAAEFFAVFGKSGIWVQGNHDCNWTAASAYGLPREDILIPDDIAYDRTVKNIEDIVTFDEMGLTQAQQSFTESQFNKVKEWWKMHYYIDDNINKIRYIVYESWDGGEGAWLLGGYGVLVAQYDFIARALQTIPEGYDAVVSCHELGDFVADTRTPTFNEREINITKLLYAYKNKGVASLTLNDISWPFTQLQNYWRAMGGVSIDNRQFDFSTHKGSGNVFAITGHFHNDVTFVAQTKNSVYSVQRISSNTIADTPTYSNASTYAIGDERVYNGTIYVNKTAIDTAEEFDATKWLELLAKDDIGNDAIYVLWRNRDAYNAKYIVDGSPQGLTGYMTKNTITEQSFDIVTIANNKVCITKIGAGDDVKFDL